MRTIFVSIIAILSIGIVEQNSTAQEPMINRAPFKDLAATPNSPAQRLVEIQAALKQQGFDGWLFYDFRGSDILTPRILNTTRLGGSRRWFYFVPAVGEPVKVVHAIEPGQLDSLPGRKLIYREWQLLRDQV